MYASTQESQMLNGLCWKIYWHTKVDVQKIYYSLQQQKVKSVEHVTTITELVVVWSVCSTCTCAVNQRFLCPQSLMQRFTLLRQMLQGVVKLLYLELADWYLLLLWFSSTVFDTVGKVPWLLPPQAPSFPPQSLLAPQRDWTFLLATMTLCLLATMTLYETLMKIL